MPVFYNKNICHGGQRLLRKQITSQPATGLPVTPSDSLRAAAVGWRVCPKPPTQCVSHPPPGPRAPQKLHLLAHAPMATAWWSHLLPAPGWAMVMTYWSPGVVSPSAAWRFHAAFCPSAVQPGAQCFSTETQNDPPAKWQKKTLKHVEKWKNPKNKSSTSFKISSSIFCGTLFIPYFCWRLGHQLLPPRAAVAGWRVGWARWNHQPRHAHAAFAFGAQVLHSW